MVSLLQRVATFGDWTVCQDKESTPDIIRSNSVDAVNQFIPFDWCIADYQGNKDIPYIYVPNRVYPMDTVVLKDTLEGFMPIPENLDGNCKFETVSKQTLIPSATASSYSCSAKCPHVWECEYFSTSVARPSAQCVSYSGFSDGVMLPLAVGVRGVRSHIDFTIKAQSAFEYLDVRITDWPRQYSYISGFTAVEFDTMGWVPGQNVGVDFTYSLMGNNIVRIWGFPGNNGRWGPCGTNATIRVVFTLLGQYLDNDLQWAGEFPETTRTVEVSYVGAGRRGNHR